MCKVFSTVSLFCLFLALATLNCATAATTLQPNSKTAQISALIAASRAQKLATADKWLRLVYYQPRGNGFKSQADDAKFFNAANGKTDPQAELEATIAAFFAPVDANDANAHPKCRFIARYHYLASQLPQLKNANSTLECSDFANWRQQLEPDSATLIFPAAYINSPSSMFGHTLIRINKKNQQQPMLGHSISYAASMPDKVGFYDYVIGGLFGGYPGFMYEAAYYDKIIEYNDIEARDIWEYPLNLSQQQLEFMLMHIWELQKVRFDYYFFDENCALRLLNVLDVAVDDLNSSADFTTHAIPADTVRALQQRGMLQTAVYRPSLLSELKINKRQFNRRQQRQIVELALSEKKVDAILSAAKYTAAQQATMLDFSYDYLRYLARREGKAGKRFAQRSLAMLNARSKLPAAEKTTAKLPQRPDLGHNTARFAIGHGEYMQQSTVFVAIRPAFHDILDDDRGYVKGAQIDFLSLYGRYLAPQQQLEISRFSLLDIMALPSRDRFFKPISWLVNLGFERVSEQQQKLHFALEFGGGVTHSLANWWDISLLGKTKWRIRGNFQGFDAGIGAHASMLFGLPLAAKLQLSTEYWQYEGNNNSDLQLYSAGLNIPLVNSNHALRLSSKWQRQHASNKILNHSLYGAYHYYF